MKYKLYRVDRIRPTLKSSAFIFGSALDAAVENIALKNADPYETFLNIMEETEHNGETFAVPKSPLIKYTSKDFQYHILTELDIQAIQDYANELNIEILDIESFMTNIKDRMKKGNKLYEEEVLLYNYNNWISLTRKGYLFMPLIEKWFEENVEETISVQKKVITSNDAGDELIGYLDLILKFKDGVTRIIDIKTSSNPKKYYPEDKVGESPQLVIYAELEEIEEVGYYVLDKDIRKREPRVRDWFVTGTVNHEAAEKTFDKLEESVVYIKEEVFEKNKDSCFKYGRCEYYDLCHKNSMKNLVHVPKKETK
jgi:RecB family exonuclease